MKKEYFVLFLVLCLGAFLRFCLLGVVPVGVTHDELGYIYNAYSIAETGRNVFGEFMPIFTWMNSGGWPFLPVPIYLTVPLFWIFDLSATVGRLPSAFLGVLDVLLLYILVKQIFNRGGLALLSALFLAISPWHLHLSRSAYDPNFALFFYLLGISIFLYEIRRNKLPIFSLVAFFLAIFSYRAMNILFLPMCVVLLWYGVKMLSMQKGQTIVFALGSAVIFLTLFAATFFNRGYVTEALGAFRNPKMGEEIDIQIRQAQGPLFVRRMFLNKPAYIIDSFRKNYVHGYSPEFLFLSTESSKIYSIWSRGRTYFLDLPLIVLGIVYVFTLSRYGGGFILALVLMAGLPGMLTGFPYTARNFFLSGVLPILSAGGVFWILRNPFITRVKQLVIICLIVAYTYLLGSYLFDYYGRFSLYGAEAWAKSLKDISSLISEDINNFDQVVVGTTSFGDVVQYAFYTHTHPSIVQKSWESRKVSEKGSSFSFESVTFIPQCLDLSPQYNQSDTSDTSLLYIVHENCDKFATPSSIIRDYQGNSIWKVYKIHERKEK